MTPSREGPASGSEGDPPPLRGLPGAPAPVEASSGARRRAFARGLRIAHLSDVHVLDLTGVPWTRFLNKRLTGLVNLIGRRRHAHPISLLERIVADVNADHIDHVVVTGDLSNLALESEFARARALLAPLGGAERLSVIPGNHDVYTRGSQRTRRFDHAFAQWMWPVGPLSPVGPVSPVSPAGAAAAQPGAYPWLKRIGDVSLLGFSSAVARVPFLATGEVGPDQLTRLDELAASGALAGTFPIALVHHNVHRRSWRKTAMHGLKDRDFFLDRLEAAGVRMVLHGHTHVSHRWQRGGLTIVGSGSSTWSAVHPDHIARYNVYHFEGPTLTDIEIRRFDAALQRFEHHARLDPDGLVAR